MNEKISARRRAVQDLMFGLTAGCAAVALSALFFILGYIAWRGISSVSWSFLTRLPRPVGESGGGIANAILGSAEIVAMAAAMGVPIGVLSGVYLSEYGGGEIAASIRLAADALNGVPSIVLGLFAYLVMVKPLKHFSALSGAFALAVLIVPIVLRNTEEFLHLVPLSLREAALALGVPQWKVIVRVVLPAARRGIVTGSLLALSRAAGETAPLIFTAFGNQFWGRGPLQPVAALPLTIFNYAISPYDELHRQAWAAALILMAFVLAVNLVTRLILQSPAAEAR